MPVSKEQIKELLGSGLGPEVVASAVGCDISYVSQLLSDELFATEVTARRTLALQSHTKRDNKIDSIEDRLLDKLDNMLDETVAFMKPRDALMAFSVINKAVRRGAPVHGTGGNGVGGTSITNIINLQLPQKIVRKFTRNSKNEVVETEGQTLVTMPSHMLLRNLSEQATASGKSGDGEKYTDALKFLPGGVTTTIATSEAGNYTAAHKHQSGIKEGYKEGEDFILNGRIQRAIPSNPDANKYREFWKRRTENLGKTYEASTDE